MEERKKNMTRIIPNDTELKELLSESSRTPTHDLALTDQLGVKLAAVEGEVDVKVDAVEGPLGRIHSLKVLFEVLAREVRG